MKKHCRRIGPTLRLGCQKTAGFSQNHYPGNGPVFQKKSYGFDKYFGMLIDPVYSSYSSLVQKRLHSSQSCQVP